MLIIGDLVQLKSGGPEMTVTSDQDGGSVYAVWFAGKKRERASFPVGALDKVVPAPAPVPEKK